jgi:ectoine hydroxylase-related dioxygenase (phytanoyl-CoA dioxygenase family)
MTLALDLNTLPEISSDYALAPETIAAYQRDAVTLVRGLATADEINAYRPLINEAVARYNQETRPLEERDTYGMAFLQTSNLWARDAAVKRFSFAKRFAKVAAQLLGVDGVRMYHDQALYKEPGGGITPWHQDQHYWPLATDRVVTMWMPLVDVAAEIGTLTFAPGSHNKGYLGDLPISDQSQNEFQQFVADNGWETKTFGAMNAGDATFHSGWILHTAPSNPSKTFRREIMTVIYMDADMQTMHPDNKNRADDLAMWLPGVSGGEPAASPLNPVLYSSR